MSDSSSARRLVGRVTERGDALIELRMTGPAGHALVVCLVDTGFTGALLLPEALTYRLRLPRLGPTSATLADGSRTVLRRCEVVVDWLFDPQSVRALAAPGPTALVGVGLLRSHRLVIDYPARTVEIG